MDSHSNVRMNKISHVPALFVALILLPIVSACQHADVDKMASPDVAATVASSESKAADASASDAVTAAADTGTPYSIDCEETNADGAPVCYVDKATFIGWRTYHGFCHVCHAQDAVGSTFAPSLVERMKEVDWDLFVDRTGNGYTGQIGVMPPWKDNPNVSKRYKELFAYLKARSDGALQPGRPKKKP